MKMLPKLMKNGSSVLTIQIVSEEMPEFSITLVGATSWPVSARIQEKQMLRFFDLDGNVVHEIYTPSVSRRELLPNFALAFMGVVESSVDFKTKSQSLVAKMRAVNLDAHENLFIDNFDSYEG
jgi:hypothetical protein